MIVHESPLPDVTIPDVTITELTLRHATDDPARVALVDGPTGRTITYAQLDEQIHELAGGLAARGFGPGSTLALMAPNIPEYAVVFHGAAVAGGTVTTVNPVYGAREVAFQLRDAGASIVVTVGAFAATATEAAAEVGIDGVFVIDEGAGTPISELMGEAITQVGVDPREHVVVLPYSSGTTGLPKGVMLTHRNLVANIVQTESVIRTTDHEVAFAVLPFFHIYGMQVLMNFMLAQGGTIVTMPRFDLEQALSLTQDWKVTRFFAVPPIVLALAKHPAVDQYDFSSVKQVFSGAAPLGAELAAAAAERLGCEVVQGYGMTELSPVSHSTVEGQARAGSCGVTVASTRTRIVDTDTGDDLGVGEEGELLVAGPQVMTGYLNNPQATASTIDDDGWLHTGDVARVDEDGHVFIVDRVKELIKFKGFQVPPAELEALLVTHPAVADVAVIGVPDDEAGEIPKAFVVRAPGTDVDAAALQAFVADELASYKQVRVVEFIDEIPKSAAGKILRRELRDR